MLGGQKLGSIPPPSDDLLVNPRVNDKLEKEVVMAKILNIGSPIAGFKGEVSKCHLCANADTPGVQRTYCARCLTRGWVAKCLKCEGSGLVGGGNVWGNEKKGDYHSICDACGGKGVFPAPAPDAPPLSSASNVGGGDKVSTAPAK